MVPDSPAYALVKGLTCFISDIEVGIDIQIVGGTRMVDAI
jgi:hypothetical protein